MDDISLFGGILFYLPAREHRARMSVPRCGESDRLLPRYPSWYTPAILFDEEAFYHSGDRATDRYGDIF